MCPGGVQPDCSADGPNCYCYNKSGLQSISALQAALSQWYNVFHGTGDDLDWYSGGQDLENKCGPSVTAANWVGYINIPQGQAGQYTFYLDQAGGSAVLYLDGSSTAFIDTTNSKCACLVTHLS